MARKFPLETGAKTPVGVKVKRIQEKINKEKSKAEEFFEPVREYVGENDIQGLGFDARK